MVRRWSYINNLNSVNSLKTYRARASSLDAILNVIMYLRQDFPVFSNAYRKNWARRKHANQALFLTNVMINWAKEYRFYKNYNRMIQRQFFFKNTYLAVNLVIQKGPHSERTKHEHGVVGSSMTHRTMGFFQRKFAPTRFQSLLKLSASTWSYASYNLPYDINIHRHANAPYTPLFYVPFNTQVTVPLENTTLKTQAVASVMQLFQLTEQLIRLKLIEFYSLSIKLLLFKLF